MSNTNTIKQSIAGQGPQPVQGTIAPLALGTSTSETTFSMTVPLVNTLGGGPAVLVAVDQSGVPQFYDLARPIKVRGYGTIVTGVSTNITLKLYQVPSAIVKAGTAGTVGNDNLLKASTARAVNSTTASFLVEATLQWSAASQSLQGTAKFLINSLLDAEAATTAVAITADSELNFILSATSSSGNAANVITLSEFSLEQV